MRFLTALCLCVIPLAAQGGAVNSCDLNADGVVDKADVDLAIPMALGKVPCKANIAGLGVCNAVVVQRIVVASLGGDCALSDGSHSVQLTWVASVSSNVAGYNVLRGATSGGPYTLLTSAVVPGTSFLDTTVQAGKTYFYVVTAVDTSSASSSFSNEAPAAVPTP